MVDKYLHIVKINHENYLEPDIPVNEAWAEMKSMLNKIPVDAPPAKLGKPFSIKLLPYAAIALLLTAVTAYYFLKDKPKEQLSALTFYTQDKPQKDTLSDGSIVFLNRYSSISEFDNAVEKKPLIVKGAAYFIEEQNTNQQVHHLKIGEVDVMPLKATIYVSFDTASSVSLVHLHSGTAVIEADGKKLTLNGGESIQFDNISKQFGNKQKVDANLFSYATKIFEFRDTPLNEAAHLLENAYGTDIVFENEKLSHCRITTRFDNKSLKEILDIMSYTLNFNYKTGEKNNQVVLTGDGCE